MKRIKPLLKVASVVSAVLLVAALIACRAGAFEWLPYYKARMFSSSKSYNFDVPLPPANTAPVGTQATEAEPHAAPLQFTGKQSGTSELMGSSKSANVFRARAAARTSDGDQTADDHAWVQIVLLQLDPAGQVEEVAWVQIARTDQTDGFQITPAGVLTVKRPHLLLKVAAVASALLLVAALVCYRAGAFSRFSKPTPATAGESTRRMTTSCFRVPNQTG